LRNAGDNSCHAGRRRRHPMITSGTAAATITSTCCSRAPGASTRNSGIENSVRSNVA
jgi:hypothetical protein